MAHASWTITTPTEKTSQPAAKSKKISAGTGSSFASMMAKEQSGVAVKSAQTPVNRETGAQTAQAATAKTAKAKPVVARLPEPGIPLQNNMVLAGRSPSDLLRAQTFNRAQTDLQQTRAVESFMQSMASGGSTLDVARGLGVARNLRTIAAANNGKGFALASSDFIHTSARTSKTGKNARSQRSKMDGAGIGKLSARFESGSDGIAAIGYDSTGGTSYGKYQIASRVGSMKSFLAFLDREAPDIAKRLKSAGPANTGSRRGGMPDEWRSIAKEQPERFEQLQEAFIHESHYQPALKSIEQCTGIDQGSLSAAMREVIWSTAVQHGPAGAARIFARADNMSGSHASANYERKLINNVYNLRAGQFGSSTSQVREAVRNRFKQEKQLALNMLDAPTRATLA